MSPRLLVLDDDKAIVGVLQRYFAGRGFHVEACLDPAEALSRVEADEPYDAVICDLHFTPARLGEGLEIVERARRRRPTAAVVLFTGATGEAIREEALRLGACDVLPKPSPLAKLHDTVLRAMKRP